jgi:hypothetical protein
MPYWVQILMPACHDTTEINRFMAQSSGEMLGQTQFDRKKNLAEACPIENTCDCGPCKSGSFLIPEIRDIDLLFPTEDKAREFINRAVSLQSIQLIRFDQVNENLETLNELFRYDERIVI